jgi:UDP-N-acetylglucosamine 4-epimerase
LINGDGTITRDFTHVENVVKANLNALSEDAKFEGHEVFNIACGATTTLNDLWDKIKLYTGADAESIKGPNRPGDILHSLADISKAAEMIDYSNLVMIEEGLSKTIPGYVSAAR